MEILDIIGTISDFGGFVGAIASTMIYFKMKLKEKRDNEIIPFVLKIGNEKKIELPLKIRRGDLSRAEVLGRIGMLPMREKGKRFSLKGISNPSFLEQLNAVQNGVVSIIEIDATDEEVNQFDL